MDVDVVEMRRQTFRSKVLRRVSSPGGIAWSKSVMPTLVKVDCLRELVVEAGADPGILLADFSAATSLEISDGNWQGVMKVIGGEGAGSVAESAAAFRRHVAPSMEAVSTREKAWASWRTVLTWAAARSAMGELLPMPVEVFQAVTFDLLSVLASQDVVKGVWDAIAYQHRHHRKDSPIASAGGYGRLAKCIARFAGTQRPMKYPVHRDMVVAMLRSRPQTLVQLRDGLASVVATLTCLRPGEGAALQVCDAWFDYDARAGGAYCTGTAALNVLRRKNDQGRKGHHPRLGRAKDPALDVVHQLKAYLRAAGLVVSPRCGKKRAPQARCRHCPPLFPRAVRGAGGVWTLRGEAVTPAGFSEMIPRALERVGVSAEGFSGVCARRGGITTAIEAGVPEHVLWMQSGHAQDRAARQYVVLSASNPELLFQTFQAFGL